MSLFIKFIEYGTWESPAFGAVIQLIDRPDGGYAYSETPLIEDSRIVDAFIGSTFPNPYKPKHPMIRLQNAYPLVKAGTYRYRFSSKAHNRKPGFDIEDNERVPTIYPNPNPKSKFYKQYFADHVDLHAAYSNAWRGSAACLTILPACVDEMYSYFEDGDEGDIEIVRIGA